MTELKRVIGLKSLVLITITSIIGTGIFFLPSIGARIAGPASIISWIVLSIIAIYISMCFAELSSIFPKEGGIYEFCKQAFGRFTSFLVGWMSILIAYITISMMMLEAIQSLLPYNIPSIKIPLSLAFIIIFNFIAYRGMKISEIMLASFSVIIILTLIMLIISGFFNFKADNFIPFFPRGYTSIYLAFFFLIETFFGWEAITFLGGEIKNSEKTMPKALILSTILISVISITLAISSLGSLRWDSFGFSQTPLEDIAETNFGTGFGDIFAILIYLALIGSVACWIVSSPRLILAMSRDNLFLKHFSKIHPKRNTPSKAIMLQTIIIIFLVIVVGIRGYLNLLSLLLPIALIMYSFVLIALVVLRYKKPYIYREYKAPFGKTVPFIVIVFMLSLIIFWLISEQDAVKTIYLSLSLIGASIPLYFLIEMRYNLKFIFFIDDILAYLTLLTENLLLPYRVRKHILHILGEIKGKKILEYGCKVGTLTRLLAEKVGKDGKIFATNLSKREGLITEKRIKKLGHKHVTIICDQYHHKRIHPDVPKIDAVVSVGILEYIQDINNVLKNINQRLKIGSKICFVDYDNIFDIISTKEWLKDDNKIKELFKNSGFNVAIMRKQGFAWRYVYIYGVKVRDIL